MRLAVVNGQGSVDFEPFQGVGPEAMCASPAKTHQLGESTEIHAAQVGGIKVEMFEVWNLRREQSDVDLDRRIYGETSQAWTAWPIGVVDKGMIQSNELELANAEAAKSILAQVIPHLPETPDWPDHRALDSALVTDRKLWPSATIEKLRPILGRFL